MVDGDRVRHLLQEGRLARLGRRDDEAALALAERRDELRDPGFDEIGLGLELESFDRVDADQLGKG